MRFYPAHPSAAREPPATTDTAPLTAASHGAHLLYPAQRSILDRPSPQIRSSHASCPARRAQQGLSARILHSDGGCGDPSRPSTNQRVSRIHGHLPSISWRHGRNTCMTKADKAPMRLTWLHLLLLGAIGLLLLGAVVFVQVGKRQYAREHSPPAAVVNQGPSATLRPSGRERCMRKCAVIQKGYVYRPEPPQSAASAHSEPAFCACV